MSPGRGKAKGKKKQSKKKKHHVRGGILKVELCNCAANPDWLELSKKNGDQVQWKSADGGGYDITFVISPFAGSQFRVDPNGSTTSGKITVPYPIPPQGIDFKYNIDGDSGCHQDPVIHIGP